MFVSTVDPVDPALIQACPAEMVTALAGALQSLGADTSQSLVLRIERAVETAMTVGSVPLDLSVFFKHVQSLCDSVIALKPSKTNSFVVEIKMENQQADRRNGGGNYEDILWTMFF